MSATRRLLVMLLLTGVLGLDQPGTFASFGSSTTNGSTFATGTLVLSNKRNNAAACFSNAGGATDTNANDCAAIFTLPLQDGGASNARITVANDGSLDASSLQLHWTGGETPCVTTDDPSTPYHGGGDLCDWLRLQIQEYPDATAQTGNDRTNGYCWFGGNAGTNACSYNNNQDLAAFSLLDGTPPDVIDMGPIASGATRYFRVYIQLPLAQVTNDLMGRLVEFGFTWSIEQ